jgi:hypothetical protein
MTTSWTKLVSSDEAARRAAGRRHYNAHRHYQAMRRRGRVLQLVEDRGGLCHGVRAAVARELGVSRSTVSRDVAWLYYAPRELRPGPPGPSAAKLIALLEPLGERLAAADCRCGEDDLDEPRHALGHVLKVTAETLDAMEEGTLILDAEDVARLQRLRDQVIQLLRR